MTSILCIYSADDLASSVSTYIGDRIASLLEEREFDVTRLDLWKANRLLFTLQRLIKPVDFVIYCGHGNIDRWYGSLTMGGLIWPLVDLMNAGLLSDKVCYAIACRTGLQLGRGAPARSYLGWKVDVYVSLPALERNYTGDFLDAFLQVPFALAEGKTVREAGQAYLDRSVEIKRLYDANLDRWPNADFYAMAVENNIQGFEVLGDAEARIR